MTERDEGRCVDCGHTEDDHDGYGGLCDGDTDVDARTMCGCVQYQPAPSPQATDDA